jgi:hypothetical protein
MFPPNGGAASSTPTFVWSQLVENEICPESYHFQLDPYYDFRAPIVDDAALTQPMVLIENELNIGEIYYWRFRWFDGIEYSDFSRQFAVYISYSSCGDANNDSKVNVSDAVYIINYAFAGGPAPEPLEAADCNCDSRVNVSDAV